MVLAMNSTSERAFQRAKELLSKESALTHPECDELEELFDEVSGSQFIALTQDPQHRRTLRQYDRYVHRHARMITAVLAILFIVSVVIGAFLTA